MDPHGRGASALRWGYLAGVVVTFGALLWQDAGSVRGAGWLLAVPVDVVAAIIWPGYWLAVALGLGG